MSKKIKTYYVFVNCGSFRQFTVEATSKAEAESKACRDFQCPDQGGDATNETRIATEDDLNEGYTHIEAYQYQDLRREV